MFRARRREMGRMPRSTTARQARPTARRPAGTTGVRSGTCRARRKGIPEEPTRPALRQRLRTRLRPTVTTADTGATCRVPQKETFARVVCPTPRQPRGTRRDRPATTGGRSGTRRARRKCKAAATRRRSARRSRVRWRVRRESRTWGHPSRMSCARPARRLCAKLLSFNGKLRPRLPGHPTGAASRRRRNSMAARTRTPARITTARTGSRKSQDATGEGAARPALPLFPSCGFGGMVLSRLTKPGLRSGDRGERPRSRRPRRVPL